MTCKRCEDIHLAQKSGKTQKSCECVCHDEVGNITWATDTTATTGTLNLTFDGNGVASDLWSYGNTSTADINDLNGNDLGNINRISFTTDTHKCSDYHYPPKCGKSED